MPTTPFAAAGRRTEPPVSEPRLPNARRAATAAPEPLDEPQVMWSVFQGLRQWPLITLCPVGPSANSAMLSAPSVTAPAAARRSMSADVACGTNSPRTREPQVVTWPAS